MLDGLKSVEAMSTESPQARLLEAMGMDFTDSR